MKEVALEKQTLLIRWDTLLVLNLRLNVVDGIGWLNLKGDSLSGQSLDGNGDAVSKVPSKLGTAGSRWSIFKWVGREARAVDGFHDSQSLLTMLGFLLARSGWSVVKGKSQSVLQICIELRIEDGSVPKLVHCFRKLAKSKRDDLDDFAY